MYKKILVLLAVSLLSFSSISNASTESIVSGSANGDEFTLVAKQTAGVGAPFGVTFARLLTGSTASFNILPGTFFDGITLQAHLDQYATTGALAAEDARIDTLETSGFSGDYNDLTNKPSLFSGAYSDLTGKPSLFSGAYADLTGKPSLFSGAYADLSGKPTLFSGSYTDLTNKPTIPSTFDQLTDGSTNKAFTSTLLTKLNGIATGATANSSDATLLARANHTGTQAISTVSGLQTALDAKQASITAGAAIADAATNAGTGVSASSVTILGISVPTNTSYTDLVAAHNDLATKYNDLSTKFNTLVAHMEAQGLQTP